MSSATIHFDTAGVGRCFYTEIINLSMIGNLNIKRATTIAFDNENQVWRVMDMNGIILHEDKSRQACLDWERENADRIAQNGNKENGRGV